MCGRRPRPVPAVAAAAVLLAVALGLPAPAAATPPSSVGDDGLLDGAALAAHWTSLEETLALRAGGALPALEDADWNALAAGETVIKQQQIAGSDMLGATVFRVSDVAAWRIWLAICDRDHHEEFMPHIAEGVCLEDFGDSRLVYQYLALPAVRDRHWIIRTRTNGPLWLASDKTVWESSWSLEPDAAALIDRYGEAGAIPRIDAAARDTAIVTPINDGCWLLVDLPDGRTLIAYQDLSDIGGKVPAWLVNEIGPGGLARLVVAVERRGASIEDTFDDTRPPPAAPDGTAVEQLVLPGGS